MNGSVKGGPVLCIVMIKDEYMNQVYYCQAPGPGLNQPGPLPG